MGGMWTGDISLAPGTGLSAPLAGKVQGRGREGSQELRCKPRSPKWDAHLPLQGQDGLLGSDSCPVRKAEKAKAPVANRTPGVGTQPLFPK